MMKSDVKLMVAEGVTGKTLHRKVLGASELR